MISHANTHAHTGLYCDLFVSLVCGIDLACQMEILAVTNECRDESKRNGGYWVGCLMPQPMTVSRLGNYIRQSLKVPSVSLLFISV